MKTAFVICVCYFAVETLNFAEKEREKRRNKKRERKRKERRKRNKRMKMERRKMRRERQAGLAIVRFVCCTWFVHELPLSHFSAKLTARFTTLTVLVT